MSLETAKNVKLQKWVILPNSSNLENITQNSATNYCTFCAKENYMYQCASHY